MKKPELPFDEARTASNACAPQHEHPRQASEVSPKNDATPTAIGASVQNQSVEGTGRNPRRSNRRSGKVRVRDTSREAYACTAAIRMKARAEVLRAFVQAGIDGLADFQVFAMLPAWGESTLRPARIGLVEDGILVPTALRRFHKSRHGWTVWRFAAFEDAPTLGSTAADPCSTHERLEQGQQPQPPQQPAPLDSERARTPEPAPQASEQPEPGGAGGAA